MQIIQLNNLFLFMWFNENSYSALQNGWLTSHAQYQLAFCQKVTISFKTHFLMLFS